jgi:hypothetical protein
MNTKFEKEEVEIMRIILKHFTEREFDYEKIRNLRALWKVGNNDPLLSIYMLLAGSYPEKTIK